MELHHDKHHHAYVESLNAALAPYPHLADLDIDDLRGRLAGCPSKSARLCATMAAVTPITRCSGRSWLRTRAARGRDRPETSARSRGFRRCLPTPRPRTSARDGHSSSSILLLALCPSLAWAEPTAVRFAETATRAFLTLKNDHGEIL